MLTVHDIFKRFGVRVGETSHEPFIFRHMFQVCETSYGTIHFFAMLFVITMVLLAMTCMGNEAYEPGIYLLKSVEGSGRGKYLAFRSKSNKYLRDIMDPIVGLSSFGAGFGLVVAISLGPVLMALVLPAGIGFGGVATATSLYIPIRYLFRSKALVLSRSRYLQFDLEASDKARNAFTLKTRITRRDNHGGKSLDSKIHLKKKDGLSFVASRANTQYPEYVYLQTVDSATPKWMMAKQKKVKLHATKKSAWVLVKLSDASSSVATDGSSIEQDNRSM